jgi:hypothetical protein
MMMLMNEAMGRQRREDLIEEACRQRRQRLALDWAGQPGRLRSLFRRKPTQQSC